MPTRVRASAPTAAATSCLPSGNEESATLTAQPCIEELLVQAQSLRGPSRQRSDDECASHPLNPPELWGEVLRSHSKLRSITVCAPRVPRLSSRARSVSSAAIAAARGASSSGVSIARSVRSVHRRRGASVTVSRAPRTARARPARATSIVFHHCDQIDDRSFPRSASVRSFAVPARQISQYRKARATSQYPPADCVVEEFRSTLGFRLGSRELLEQVQTPLLS